NNEEEVLHIAKKLDKMVAKKSADHALDVLKALKKLPISLDTLQKTRIGMSVNNIRKQTTDGEVAIAAKQLIKGWKKLVSEPNSTPKKSEEKQEKQDPGNKVSTNISKSNSTKSSFKHYFDLSFYSQLALCVLSLPLALCSKPVTPLTYYSPQFPQTPRTRLRLRPTGVPVRDKCREMLVRGLQTDNTSGHSDQHCAFLAAAVEDAIYAEFKDTGVKYKNRIRSRFSNLKDTRNSLLRQNVLNGILKPEQIAKMTAEEMASDEMKKRREEYEEQNIKDHQMSVNEGTKTDMFVCGRCKGRACTYNQLQTRSADEPMTTFVFCTECGNRWKFC
uniref:Transcription elongation factor n=1 Tax=Ciona savignyi TaxID=51511 RepID=H2ZJF8_CIOSA